MAFQNRLLFHPDRILWIGIAVLVGIVAIETPLWFLLSGGGGAFESAKSFSNGEKKLAPLQLALGGTINPSALPIPRLEGEVSFSYDPPRPDGVSRQQQLMVRLKRGAQSKRVSLPCRLDLQFGEGETLLFYPGESSFWMELSPAPGGQIESRVFVHCLPEGTVEGAPFFAAPQESPIQSAQEFAEGSPFRLLGEARWWGKDLFREKFGDGVLSERLEIGAVANAELAEIREGEWLVWQEGKWQKSPYPADGKKPIARIDSVQGKCLVLEGWDADSHVRLSLAPSAGPSFKVKGEELFSSIRVRSDKQISCMLEKQCLILKTGDWILKNDGKWKILRKKEERESYLNGKLLGDLFVFEGIELKQGQKLIRGQFFNPGRSQTIQVELPAHSMRKAFSVKESADKPSRKGRPR